MKSKLVYHIGRMSEEEAARMDFIDGISRSIDERIALGIIPIKLQVIDDKPYRIFNTMKEYRKWCNKALPKSLGYYNG